jgi:hypothetical protein
MEDELLTRQQRKSLELWVSQLSDALIIDGQDLRQTMTYPIIPTRNAVREMIVKPVLYALTGYTSTKQIRKLKDLDILYDTICKALGEKGISVPPFPSEEVKNFNEVYK